MRSRLLLKLKLLPDETCKIFVAPNCRQILDASYRQLDKIELISGISMHGSFLEISLENMINYPGNPKKTCKKFKQFQPER